MSECLRVGIVGAGAITRGAHLPVLKNIPRARVAWITDAQPRAAHDAVAAFGLAATVPENLDSLPPCDVVLLAVPLHARDSYMQHFARHGMPLFAEKPFAISMAEHRRYLDLFGQVPVACAYMRRTYANVRALRRIVRNGWFGELRGIRYAEGGRTTKTEFGSATLDLSHRMGGGVLRDLGCHGLDAIGFITGAAASRVDRCEIEWDRETDRHVDAHFEVLDVGGVTGARCEVHYTVSWLLDQPNAIELEFERARLRCGIKPEAELAILDDPAVASIRMAIDEPGARSNYQSFFLEWDAVLESLDKADESGFSARAERSLWTTHLVEQLYVAGGAP